MQRLTTRRKFAFVFSFYVLVFLVILYSIFFIAFSLTSTIQIRRDLTGDLKEIIDNHLLLENGEIIFRKDETGASLRQFLVNENTSSLIADSNGKTVRSYGAFVFTEPGNLEYDKNLKPILDRTIDLNKSEAREIKWDSRAMQVVSVPLKSNGRIIGALVLGRSLDDLIALRRTIMFIFAFLGVLSIGGSFIVGYLLARNTFMPLISLSRSVVEMDLDKLDTTLGLEGHPQDELVILVDKFNNLVGRVKDMTQRQKSFIANASHELKTPLTRAISTLEVALLKKDNRQEINLAREDLFGINTLLEKLILLSRLKKDDHIREKPKKINTSIFVHKIISLYKDRITAKNLLLETSYPDSIKSDLPEEYLGIIVSNLVSNAIKYSAHGQKIRLTMEQLNKAAKITVTDEGTGMSPEELKHMFERFYRGGTGAKEKGYGIGLSIVKQIADIYGIKIHAESTIGKGTKVSFILNG